MPEPKPKPCECKWLERADANPKVPISFDFELNEFHLHYPGGQLMIYYCPFCGGTAPESLRDTFFTVITPDEEARLTGLTSDLKTVDALIAAFGPPDHDRHTFTYKSLSTTADVRVIVNAPDQIGFFFTEKNIRPQPAHADNPNG
jgi:hypothetical protein